MIEEFLWSMADDNSPMGNDTGADVVHFYQQWRSLEPYSNSTVFLLDLMEQWGYQDATYVSWSGSMTDLIREHGQMLREAYEGQDVSIINDRDDIVIALAFAQLVVDGYIEPEIKKAALSAIARQAEDFTIDSRCCNEEIKAERNYRLTRMKQIVQVA